MEAAGLHTLRNRDEGGAMRRRQFITALGGAAATAALPLAGNAQHPGKLRRIGILMAYAEGDREGQSFVATFRGALAKLEWAEGRNVQIDIRWATAGDAAARQQFAKELVALNPDLILAHGTPTTATLLQETRTVPIIFLNVSDPIGSGFVASFAKPSGNATGFITMEPTLAGKWVELIKEIAPPVARCALLFNPTTAPYAHYFMNPFNVAATSIGVEPIIASVRDAAELETAIVTQGRGPNGGLIVMPDTFMTVHRAKITALAAQHGLPAVYPFRFFAANGGLVSYGNDTADNFRRAATYAHRILQGDKPTELPVQAPIKFELVINLQTAKALGLSVPPSLLVRADELIE
jgi:putative ABC transport system substrate-binding protein